MQKSYRLNDTEIREAIAAYIKSQEKGVFIKPQDVSIHVSRGDRPGDSDTFYVTATETTLDPSQR